MVVGEDDPTGIELLQAVDPGRCGWERQWVPFPIGSPCQDVCAVAGGGVVALPGDHDGAVVSRTTTD
jgi:hypothetical protein